MLVTDPWDRIKEYAVGGKLQMSPSRDDLRLMVDRAKAAFDALPPEARAKMRRDQRKSWFVGEMMMEHPTMTREEAERKYDTLGL